MEKACIKRLHLFHFTNDPTHEKKKEKKKPGSIKFPAGRDHFIKTSVK